MELKQKIEQELLANKKLVEQAYKEAGPYANYIKLLPQRKNIGTQSAPYYVEIMTPYMTVDGRVKMAIDEHKGTGKRFIIEKAEFFLAPDGKTQLCRVTVHSEIRGTASGTIEVGTGSGVDRYNPYANAETSAIGRALGFLGYGLLGGGIASYDEIVSAMGITVINNVPSIEKTEEGSALPEKTPDTAPTTTPTTEEKAMKTAGERVGAKEIIALKKKLKELQKTDEEIGQLLSQVKTKRDLEEVYAQINSSGEK